MSLLHYRDQPTSGNASDLKPSCPSGGNWFACTSGSLFVGCCSANDACTKTGCSDGNLKPASFNPDAFGSVRDQNCPAGSLWYSCAKNSPPFMGCCKSNPCGSSCPPGNLAAGILNTLAADGYVTGTASLPSSTSTSTATTTPTSSDSAASNKASAGTIAGAVVGGVVGLLLIAGILVFFWRRKRSRQLTHPSIIKRQGDGGAGAGFYAAVPTKEDKGVNETNASPYEHRSTPAPHTPAPPYSAHPSSAHTSLPSSPWPQSQQISPHQHSPMPHRSSQLSVPIAELGATHVSPQKQRLSQMQGESTRGSSGLGLGIQAEPIPETQAHPVELPASQEWQPNGGFHLR